MERVVLYETEGFNPHYNLAVESALMDVVKDDELIVYLWRNDNTVVIGRYQNAYLDVNVKKLYDDNGILARRMTGGGAVFHDKGNLNFSFITSRKNYDVKSNNEIIVSAVRRLGIYAEVNGRNDITVDGRKFSGNAYLKHENSALHHGTILISADTDKMQKYLNVRQDKLVGKGVSSVRSRVVNLGEFGNNITINSIKSAIIAELSSKYVVFENGVIDGNLKDKIDENYKKFSDESFVLGQKVALKNNKYKKFSWGYADVHFTISKGVIEDIEIFSDSIFPEEIESAKSELVGKSVLQNYGLSTISRDIMDLILE